MSDNLSPAMVALRSYTQADQDGVMVLTSRRAIHEVTTALDRYVIWSNEHQSWWRSNCSGYCVGIEGAGVYSREKALQIARTARDGWRPGSPPPEIALPVADVPSGYWQDQAVRDRMIGGD